MMMIEDDELRSLYQVSGEARLQKLETELLRLEQDPDNEVTLAELLREVHGLKGDSRSLGVESVELLSHQFEEILKSIQRRELGLTLEVNNCLYQGLVAIGQLVQSAVTGEPSGVDIEQVLNSMITAISNATSIDPSAVPDLDRERQPALALIDDEELREIYRTTSDKRLQTLKTGLLYFEKHPDDEANLSELLREVHSLKGDSRSAEVEVVAIFAAQVEDIFKQIQRKEIRLTSQVNDGLLQGLNTIGQLVQAAVTGEPSGVDIEQKLNALMTIASATLKSQDNPLVSDSASQAHSTVIETEELQEIYKTTSEERLQKLETGLLHLEKHPDDEATLSELLRETHSLKGDSRSVGLITVETLAHQIEGVLEGIQRREIGLTLQVSDCLYQGLDAMNQLVHQAVTNAPTEIDVAQVLNQLMAVVLEPTLPESASEGKELSEILEELPSPSLKVGDPYRIDTIRVHTRDLDVLMTQTEELTVARIQLAQTATEIEQLATLWEDWKTSRSKHQSLSSSFLNTNPYEEKLENLITTLRTSAQESSAKLNIISRELGEKVRTLRLLPLSTVFQSFPRMVRDLAKQQSKAVELIIEGGETTVDKRILEEIKDSLMHMVRNAIDHGIETPDERERLGKSSIATIWLRGYQTATNVIIEVTDDGRGLDIEKIKQTAIKRGLYRPEELESMTINQLHALILTSGFSTRTFITEISGRGVGLDVVHTHVERLKGNIQIESTSGQGCTFRIQLSPSLATANVILVEVQGVVQAFPVEFVQVSLLVSQDQMTTVDGRDVLIVGEQTVPVAYLGDLLNFPNSPALDTVNVESPKGSFRPCVLLKVGEEQVAFLIDRLLDTQEVVLKPLGPLLKQVRYVTGATILGTGDICMILNPLELLQSLQSPTPSTLSIQPKSTSRRQPTILLVEDSPLVRIQERRLFESAGYEVVIAVDGLDGYEKLRTRRFDAVVSDVEMPNLDGLSFTAKIRQHREYDDLPIILVTTLSSDDDRQRGAIAGANAYITKGKFNQDFLLETLEKLV